MTSAASVSASTASIISRVVCTLTAFATPSGTGTDILPCTSTTSAPLSAAASASAQPILPLEWLVMTRTPSIYSSVAPEVTSTLFPSKSLTGRRISWMRSAMSAGSAILPLPVSPQASLPTPGSTNMTPRSLRSEMLSCVASSSYMAVFIAGATSLGASDASHVVESMSSAMPRANFAMTFAVAGATTKTSASFARAT